MATNYWVDVTFIDTERVRGEEVSGNFFSVLGLNPQLGRLLTEADDQMLGTHLVTDSRKKIIAVDFL